MTTHHIYCILAALLLIATGCADREHSRGRSGLRNSTSCSRADSLMLAFDSLSAGSRDGRKALAIASRLDSAAAASSHPQVKARALEARSVLARTQGHLKEADSLRTAALTLTDKEKYPYDWASVYIQTPEIDTNHLTREFETLQECSRIFLECGDSMKAANAANRQAACFEALSDYQNAAAYVEKAVALLPDSCKVDRWVMQTNMAIFNYKSGREEEAARMAKELEESGFRDIYSLYLHSIEVWINIINYDTDRNPERLKRILYLSENFRRVPDWTGMYASALLSRHYLNAGGPADSLAKYHSILRTSLNPDLLHYAESQRINGAAFNQRNMPDSAAAALKEALRAEKIEKRIADAAALEKKRGQEDMLEAAASAASGSGRSAALWIGLAVLLAAGALGAAACLRKRGAKTAQSDHSDLSDLSDQSDTADPALRPGAERESRHQALLRLKEALSNDKASAAADNDWHRVELLFAELSPGFMPRLSEQYPSLTAGDLRMAGFIYLGLETKHIARLLSINPDSVKKNRQRLRAKLSLSPSEPVEAFLRHFAEKNRLDN